MRENAYKCDGCGVAKQEANHWWLLEVNDGALMIMVWSEDDAREDGVLHFCGQACVLKKVSEFLGRKP